MLRTVADWMGRLYPSKAWGQIDDVVALESGIDSDDVLALAEELATELRGAAFVREGSESDLCDYIYVLCQGREPCALQVHYDGAVLPGEWDDSEMLEEFYLRVAISSVAPLAVVQQVAVSLSMVDGRWMVSEKLAAGVYDAPLLKRFQRLVALLPTYGLTHLDMGEISEPLKGFDDSDYRDLFDRPAHQVNYLFFREPSTMQSVALLNARD